MNYSEYKESRMRTISTGQPATLGTYLGISKFFGDEAYRFMQDQILKSPNGGDEEVIAEESQMLYLLANVKNMPDDARPKLYTPLPEELFKI